MRPTALLAAIFFFFAASVLAAPARDFVMPPLLPATAMAARDAHPDEKTAFAADPYDTPQKASLFHPPMFERAVLPILVVFTNDGDETILLANAHFQLLTRDRAKADPYSLDDLRRAFTALRAPNSRAQDQIPIPLPGKNSAHGGLSAKDRDQLERAIFAAPDVALHSSVQGFLFFDVTGLDRPADGARLFLTGVRAKAASAAQPHDLMYFEVPLSQP
jgi:hypothetical protein